jgi:choline dehydrogenase-like flavoprotein
LGKQKLKDAGKHVKNVLTGLDEVAAASARKVRNRVAGVPEIPVYYFAQMMEQVPTPESRITLGDERDLFGQRRLQLNWRMTSQDMHSAMRTHLLVAAALERAGLGRFFREMHDESPPCNTEGGYHHMGTTRMHPDPKQGVVDAHCQVHGMTNLMIAGASVFPTGGYANPVLTTLALTIRLADRIKNLMA